MITVEDKLNIFHRIVLEKEEKRSTEILEELSKKNDAAIKEYTEKLNKKKEELVHKKVKNAEIKRNEKVSAATENVKSRILSKKKELLTDIMEQILKRAEGFAESSQYEDYLLNEIDAVTDEVEDQNIVIYLKNNDINRFSGKISGLLNKKGKKTTLGRIKDDTIGGFMLSDEGKTYIIDNTFKTKIDENEHIIGERLYEKLEEAGDILG